MLGRFSGAVGTFGLSTKEILPKGIHDVLSQLGSALRALSDGDPAKDLLNSLRALEGSASTKMAVRMLSAATAHVDSAIRILLHDMQVHLQPEEKEYANKGFRERKLVLQRLEAELLGLVWEMG